MCWMLERATRVAAAGGRPSIAHRAPCTTHRRWIKITPPIPVMLPCDVELPKF